MPARRPTHARSSRRAPSTTLPAAALLAFTLAGCAQQANAAYSITKAYAGRTFFDSWDFYGHYDNLTNGDIDYVNKTASSDLAYVTSAGNVIIKMDNVSDVLYPNKRRSVRIQTAQTYPIGSMWVFDFNHVPYGCSVWPSAWASSQTWPQGGEIDTFEGVNLIKSNQYAMHTASGCTVANGTSNNFSGTLTYGNCDKNANQNSGCTIRDPNTASYGAAFAAAGGGVWATQLAKDGVSIWFFPRSAVPSDLTSNSSTPSPDGWGAPVAYYPASTCSTPDFFSPQHLVITMTACGDWAGNAAVMNTTGCPLTTDLCYTSYVLNSTNFDTAYFDINSIRVYYDASRAADSAARTTATTTSPSGGSATQSIGAAKASSTSSKTSGAITVRTQGAVAVLGAAVMVLAGWVLV